MKVRTSIKAFRNEKGLKQAELAERLGVPRPLLSYWETGRQLPDYDQVKQIAKELDCTIADLYRPSLLELIQKGI